MKADKIVYDRFIAPFVGKTSKNVGTELEFPLINENGGDIDLPFVKKIMDCFEARGFRCVLSGVGGEKLFMENSDGDCVSFDNSYNNFEFSMYFGENLCDQHERFRKYFDIAQSYLSQRGHALVGRGTNPNFPGISVNHAPYATYNMVQRYLHDYPSEHHYQDFPAFLSSVQTHLDVEASLLPTAYSLFTRLDFVRGLLFANSPDFEGKGWRIYRDYLWEKSAFGSCPEITGKVDESFETISDIVSFFMKKGMFNRMRNGKYECFKPVPISEYFENPAYGAEPSDIEYYLSFRTVEITARGTLEVRGDCTQPLDRSFAPPAFNLGIITALEAARLRLDCFFKDNDIKQTNSQLRSIVAEGKDISLIASAAQIKSLCADICDIAHSGLKKRGKGEEKLLPYLSPEKFLS